MAWSFVATYAGTGNKTAGTAATATVTASSGDTLLAMCVCDNLSGSNALPSNALSDSGSNSWSQLAVLEIAGSSATAASAAIYGCSVTSALSGGTVTFTPNSSVAAKNFDVYRFTGGSLTQRGSSQSASGNNTTASVSHTSPTTGDLVLGLVGLEQTLNLAGTGDSDTSNGSWSTLLENGTTGGSSTSNVHCMSQYKIVTGSGTQTWDPSFDTADYAALLITLQPAASGGASAWNSVGILVGT